MEIRPIGRYYRILFDRFGQRGWWPLRGKYRPGEYELPRTEPERWEVSLGAILTQNTSWKNVRQALLNLQQERLFGFTALANCTESQLRDLIRPAGYFNQKALKIRAFLDLVREKGGHLGRWFACTETLELREDLLEVWGIGRETADSIVLYAAKKPIFVVDAYTRRIFHRHRLIPDESVEYDLIRESTEHALKGDRVKLNEFHALLVQTAKDYCRKREALCDTCPLKNELT